ncbi:acyltransferase family protein [Acrocarpospora sp. B8E8]|uniref:acyltransferase family protein n=1 Tax=Acrocarpospora sp. B8E8 TaxID=3153572 RepID=UPI00325EE924
MSELRHRPSVPASRPDVDPDVEDAPTGVMGRIVEDEPTGVITRITDDMSAPPGAGEPERQLPPPMQGPGDPLPVRRPRNRGAHEQPGGAPQSFDYFGGGVGGGSAPRPPQPNDPYGYNDPLGPQSSQGIHGTQGIHGAQGVQGPQDIQGTHGIHGAQGVHGPQDIQGTHGVHGAPGSHGIHGAHSAQGSHGISQAPTPGFPAAAPRPPQADPYAPDLNYPPARAQGQPAAPPQHPGPHPGPQWPEHPGGPINAPDEWSPWRRRNPYDQPGAPLPPASFDPATDYARNPNDPIPLPAWAQGTQHQIPTRGTPWSQPRSEWEEGPEPPAPPKKQREPYLDNVKFLLIATVVASHSLRDTVGDDANRAAYIFFFSFHMPLFVMISGYLSRTFWDSRGKVNKLVDTILIPYVIVEVGYAALRYALGQKWSLTITDPAWLNWYLVALLLWRLTTPVWKRMRYPLVVAIGVYLFSGFSQLEQDFSMDRFFGLMPFFVLGMVLKPEHFDFLKRTWVKVLSAIVLAVWVGFLAVYASRLKLSVFYFRFSYQDLNMTWWYGMGFRLAFLAGVLVLCAAVLALIPRKETWFSDLGVRTLYCYLLHGIPVLIAKELGWLKLPWLEGPIGTLAIIAGAFVVAIILCLPVTRTLFKWLLEPRFTWLYRKPTPQVAVPDDQKPEVQR